MTSSPTSPPPDEWDPRNRLLTINEAAASIERPASTIRRWLATGLLHPFAKHGRRTLIRESDLLATEAKVRTSVRATWDNKKPPQEP